MEKMNLETTRIERMGTYLQMELDKVIDDINIKLEDIECVQDLEKLIEANIQWLNATKQTGAKKLGFSMEEVEEIIKEYNIPMNFTDKVMVKIEAKKMEIIEKNLEIFESISYEECWANDIRFITNADEFNKYAEYLIKRCNADENTKGEFEGIGYYDYKWNMWAIRIAGLDYFYEEEIHESIEDMDRPIKIIRERKLDRQIEAYMKTLGVKKYECTMDFKSICNGADGIDRLESFLKEARKYAFVFHEQVSSEEWENKKINKDYIQMGGSITDFNFVYYIEEDKQHDFEFDIIDSYKRGMEEFIGQGRTF